MKKTILFIVILLPIIGFSQSDFCNRSYGESYYPLEIGFEKNLTWGTATYVEKVTNTTMKNGNKYYNYEQDFGGGKSYDLLLRKQHDTVFMYNAKENKDIILLIERPIKGVKWKSGKIIDTNGFFESPFCDYENLLVIENKYPNGKKEKRFYKKGLGLVAVTTKDGIKGMCVPSKEEIKSLSKPLSAFNCVNLSNKEDNRKCTTDFIHTYLITELKKVQIKKPKKEGILKFKILFDENGSVSKINSLNSIKGGKQTKNSIIKILYTLPKLRPAMTSERKSIRTSIELSIPIKTE